jgi:type II secretory pathway pseudopilin PulG
MAGLLVAMAVMTVLMSVALPSWRHLMQREREAELIFRGEQYVRAIGLFQRKFAGAFPPSIDVLYDQKFLRKKYKDPMTESGEFQILYQMAVVQPGAPGTPGAAGPGATMPGATMPGATMPGATMPGAGGAVGAGPPPAETGGPSTGASSSFGSPGTAFGTAGPRGSVIGVVSKSTKRSIRIYKGRDSYDQWQFVYTEVSVQGGQTPGGVPPGGTGPGRGGRPGTGGQSAPRPGMSPAGSQPTGSGFGRRPTSPRND